MKIYITGGTGFVGSHLARKLVDESHQVTVGGLEPGKTVLDLPESIERDRIDVTDGSTLDFDGFDCVVHLVGLSPLREPSVPYREVHVEGTGNVLREAEDSGVEDFVHLSALGADTDRDTDYLKTKGEAQEMVEESGTAWRIFRPSVLFGEGGEFLDFLYRFSTPLITLQPGRNTIFQPLYVGDLAEMIAESLEERHRDQVFDVGGPEQIKLGEIVEAVRSSRDRTTKALELPDPLFRTFMTLSERLPFTSMGMDQYRSLQTDNVADKNDAPALGKPVDDMTRLREYLEVNS